MMEELLKRYPALSECKEDLCNSLDNVFIGIKYIIDFLGWMFSNILKKLFLY